MGHDYANLMWAEMADLGDLLHTLSEDQLDTPSLCAGWRVRDVIGHMCLGHTTPFAKLLRNGLKYGPNIDKASLEMSKAWATEHSTAELLETWDRIHAEHVELGIAKLIPKPNGFVDHLIHNQDIRRPLGIPRTIPAEHTTAALDALPKVRGMFSTASKVKGLRLEATDVDWSLGDGPVVKGPAESLVMAAGGRRVALAELTGDGVAELDRRTS